LTLAQELTIAAQQLADLANTKARAAKSHDVQVTITDPRYMIELMRRAAAELAK
jgi:hypothetical protein